MKRILLIFLGISLIAGLFLFSCQKKETAQMEEGVTETQVLDEKAGEVVEKAKETVSGYGEKAKEAAAGYGEKAEEAVGGIGK